ncbi:nodulin-26 [Quercus suber]|uniref:Aquaporin nip1-2 n=1 Tax=Quercus suber TaxID=58331 RepID=A0AAW0M2U2_QUESU|nr:nodulin-26-like [Quercus suber]POE67815.1 aquaporin nip1-2 [Quercus suber]
MAENSGINDNHGVVLNVENGDITRDRPTLATKPNHESGSRIFIPFMKKVSPRLRVSAAFMQKLIAELLGTYVLIFAGCASVLTNLNYESVVGLVGISMVWGLAVMALVYTVGHVSGAHFNPSVTISFAIYKRFPWKQVPAYILAQVLGSTLASGTLRLIFNGHENKFFGTMPAGSDLQAFVMEFIITFFLLFIISGVATDSRAVGHLGGLVVGSTVLLNVLFAGPITGASMNPARTLGPAIIHKKYKGLWIYMIAPVLGGISGASAYNVLRLPDKPVPEITEASSFLTESKKIANSN